MTKHSISTASEDLVSKLTGKVHDLARGGLDLAGNAKDVAHHTLDRAVTRTQRYVESQPVHSLVIAAAVGAVAALIVSSLLRDKDGE